jgi:hypothetical protein
MDRKFWGIFLLFLLDFFWTPSFCFAKYVSVPETMCTDTLEDMYKAADFLMKCEPCFDAMADQGKIRKTSGNFEVIDVSPNKLFLKVRTPHGDKWIIRPKNFK